ncbi:ATP-dependent DNA ligase [Auraticoccus sp. F435]|uniref:DNA ligase n=1 Tax=Auraticoccus cholistanensis TaxID=2656650 RepID=A0A6A9V043_9ACTN|nr:ATP-dependent DNA ligase [Auraticoccus cholistanensis]
MAALTLDDVVTTTAAVAATRSRTAKRDAIAGLLTRAGEDEVGLVAAWLAGTPRQRRTGVGWRSLTDLPAPADQPSLGVLDVDRALDALEQDSGPGSAGRRRDRLHALMRAATAEEQSFLRRLLTGELRQGALDGVVLDAVAAAHQLPLDLVRRAAMLGGSLASVAVAAHTGGAAALQAFGLELMRPLRPMLAASAPDLESALAGLDPPWLVDAKLDGIRIQVHRAGDEVRVWSRSLDEITARVPEVVATVRQLPGERLVLDGEALAVDEHGRAVAFQDSASLAARHQREQTAGQGQGLGCWFFDLLHRDGTDLLDAPATERAAQLAEVAGDLVVPRLVTADAEEAARFSADALAAGHEGVVVKASTGRWEAGRRGGAWVKVKPRHTVDLVVLAVEHGSGRRSGLLSNIHLGARDPRTGGFVMLGKTFKGMTDEMLAWQTERFRSLAVEDSPWVVERGPWVVPLRPEQVVEIAFDGVQRSTRYPAGMALRFARVLRYRDDKTADEADTVDTVRALAAGR